MILFISVLGAPLTSSCFGICPTISKLARSTRIPENVQVLTYYLLPMFTMHTVVTSKENAEKSKEVLSYGKDEAPTSSFVS